MPRWQGQAWRWHVAWGHWGKLACARRRSVKGFFILPVPKEPEQRWWGGGTGAADKTLMSWEGEGSCRLCGLVLAGALQLMLLSLFSQKRDRTMGECIT